jgi:hypothetical protein
MCYARNLTVDMKDSDTNIMPKGPQLAHKGPPLVTTIIGTGMEEIKQYAGSRFKGADRKCGVIGHKAAVRRSSGSKPPGKQGPKAPPHTENATPATDNPRSADGSGGGTVLGSRVQAITVNGPPRSSMF